MLCFILLIFLCCLYNVVWCCDVFVSCLFAALSSFLAFFVCFINLLLLCIIHL